MTMIPMKTAKQIEEEVAEMEAVRARVRQLMRDNPSKQLSGIKSNYARKVLYCKAMGVNALDVPCPKPWRTGR